MTRKFTGLESIRLLSELPSLLAPTVDEIGVCRHSFRFSHDVHMPANVIRRLVSSSGRAGDVCDVRHVVIGWGAGLSEVDRSLDIVDPPGVVLIVQAVPAQSVIAEVSLPMIVELTCSMID
jgi:hypothetical protein